MTPGQRAFEGFYSGGYPVDMSWGAQPTDSQARWERAAKAARARQPREAKPLPFYFYYDGAKVVRVQLANRRVYRYNRRLVKHANGETSSVGASRLFDTSAAAAKSVLEDAKLRVRRACRDTREAERRLKHAQKIARKAAGK